MKISGSSLSALRAFSTGFSASAQNIANMNTDEYKAVKVNYASDSTGGVKATLSRDTTPGPALPDTAGASDQEVREGSNVALEKEIVNGEIAKGSFQANIKAVQTQDEVLGTLLDIVG